jgi:uncharacterized membrane protein
VLDVATAAAAVGSALVAGIMLAFSVSVMPGLGRRPDDQAAAAMRAMNAAILNPLFGVVFGGTALVAAALAVTAPFTGDEGSAALRAAGSLVYLVGVIGVTAAVNVPMNEALDRDDATWPGYLRRWTAWNHLRAVAGVVAAALLVAA